MFTCGLAAIPPGRGFCCTTISRFGIRQVGGGDLANLQARSQQLDARCAHASAFEKRDGNLARAQAQHHVRVLPDLDLLTGIRNLPHDAIRGNVGVDAVGNSHAEPTVAEHFLRRAGVLAHEVWHLHDAAADGNADGNDRAEKSCRGKDESQQGDLEEAFDSFTERHKRPRADYHADWRRVQRRAVSVVGQFPISVLIVHLRTEGTWRTFPGVIITATYASRSRHTAWPL